MTLFRSHTVAGIALMVLGIFLFCCNDALGKWLLATYWVWQMLVIRSVAALLILGPLILRIATAPFIGVIIALRPSAATLTWPALIAIIGSVFFAIFLITTRMLRGTHDVLLVS